MGTGRWGPIFLECLHAKEMAPRIFRKMFLGHKTGKRLMGLLKGFTCISKRWRKNCKFSKVGPLRKGQGKSHPSFLEMSISLLWRRKWLHTPVFLPGKSREQRSLVGYHPKDHKESDTTEGLSTHSCFPSGISDKELTCQCRRHRRRGFDPWVGKIPWRRAWQLTSVFLPGEPPWKEKSARLQSIGSQRVRHDSATKYTHTYLNSLMIFPYFIQLSLNFQ